MHAQTHFHVLAIKKVIAFSYMAYMQNELFA